VERELTVGRLADCDVVIPHQTISRQNAKVSIRENRIEIQNLSSTNPIRIGAERMLAGGETAPVGEGESLQIGQVRLQLQLSDLDDQVQFKIRCTNCGKVSDNTLPDCPWCGTSLAFGETFLPVPGEN
jgi:predicted component of type VI protein secretion system